jgi:hypothetical protein
MATKKDKIDAHKIAAVLRGGMPPMAYVARRWERVRTYFADGSI